MTSPVHILFLAHTFFVFHSSSARPQHIIICNETTTITTKKHENKKTIIIQKALISNQNGAHIQIDFGAWERLNFSCFITN